MKGIINHFRGSRRRKRPNYMIISLPTVTTREEAQKLVGKEVSWKTPGKEAKILKGKVTAAHGNSGCVRVIFETGMPGQSLGKEVSLA